MSVDSFFSRLNPLVAALLRSPLQGFLGRGLMLLTATGRRSGRRFTFPVGYQRDGDVLTVMVSEARRKTWWRNYLEPGPVELRLRGRTLHGRAEVVAPESNAFRELSERTLRRMPWLGRVFRVDYDKSSGLRDEQLAHLRGEIAVVRIELQDAGA